MKIKTAKTEYDLSISKDVTNLKKNISTMRRDSLLGIYNQVKPYKNYEGENIALRNAANICLSLAPMFEHSLTELKATPPLLVPLSNGKSDTNDLIDNVNIASNIKPRIIIQERRQYSCLCAF